MRRQDSRLRATCSSAEREREREQEEYFMFYGAGVVGVLWDKKVSALAG